MQIFANLEAPQLARPDIGKRLPVRGRYLEEALGITTGRTILDVLIERFKVLEPTLEWKWRPTYDDTASDNFLVSHANTMIVGPGGHEDRRDAWFGASLMAPKVRYPDHDHAPEETYLVLSDGEFLQGDSCWFSPGIGGCFYNPPGIRHAMCAGVGYQAIGFHAMWRALRDPNPKKSPLNVSGIRQFLKHRFGSGGKVQLPHGIIPAEMKRSFFRSIEGGFQVGRFCCDPP